MPKRFLSKLKQSKKVEAKRISDDKNFGVQKEFSKVTDIKGAASASAASISSSSIPSDGVGSVSTATNKNDVEKATNLTVNSEKVTTEAKLCDHMTNLVVTSNGEGLATQCSICSGETVFAAASAKVSAYGVYTL